MGMTAGAIYSYYDTRDALITALITDVHNVLADAEEAARDSEPIDDPAARLIAVGTAYRDWAVANPQQFKLVYGDPIPGYQTPEDIALTAAAKRSCAVLLGLVSAAWPKAKVVQGATRSRWADIDPALAAVARELHPELPAAAVALSLRIWGRMHGLVALEVYGHLRHQTGDPAKLYRTEMDDLVRDLGL
jgi:AcrR family transcriptional regulator